MSLREYAIELTFLISLDSMSKGASFEENRAVNNTEFAKGSSFTSILTRVGARLQVVTLLSLTYSENAFRNNHMQRHRQAVFVPVQFFYSTKSRKLFDERSSSVVSVEIKRCSSMWKKDEKYSRHWMLLLFLYSTSLASFAVVEEKKKHTGCQITHQTFMMYARSSYL